MIEDKNIGSKYSPLKRLSLKILIQILYLSCGYSRENGRKDHEDNEALIVHGKSGDFADFWVIVEEDTK